MLHGQFGQGRKKRYNLGMAWRLACITAYMNVYVYVNRNAFNSCVFVCVYGCLCVCVCACVRGWVGVGGCACACALARARAQMCVRACSCAHARARVCVRACLCMCACKFVYMCTFVWVREVGLRMVYSFGAHQLKTASLSYGEGRPFGFRDLRLYGLVLGTQSSCVSELRCWGTGVGI